MLEEDLEFADFELEDEILEPEPDDEEEAAAYIKMDFSLETPEARNEKVKEIIANTPPERLTPKYLEKLADYIIFAMDKQERKEKRIITDNRTKTFNKRETSFEGLVGKLENGEDGIYNMITNDKNIIFQPKAPITEQEYAEIPELNSLHNEILRIEELSKTARGKRAYALKKQLIEMRQDQYVIRGAYKKPIYCMNVVRSISKISLDEHVTITPDRDVISDGLFNFYDEKNISAILCNYSKLKEDSWEKVNDDCKWFMEDFDNLVDAALRIKHPMYYDLLIYKIDGKQNTEIQELLNNKYGIKHSVEYISSLWRNKIPRLIVEEAKKEYLNWYYTFVEKGQWKKCTRCGEVKLAHPLFYTRNNSAKDHWYSICKDCRNKKKVEK